MIDIFMPIQAFIKFDKVCIDNNVFRMHYKITVILLLVFCVLVTGKQFFGEPMQCMGDAEKYISVVNSYCWIYGTYTLHSLGNNRRASLHPGVGPDTGDKSDRMVHIYYQWVCFVLLLQVFMFYTPRHMWKMWEAGRLKALVAEISGPIIAKDLAQARLKDLVHYLNHGHIYSHNLYALRYALCELLNLVNVVGQIYILDIFLGHTFRSYGSAVAAFDQAFYGRDAVNPMDKYFPKVTKCLFPFYGPSGSAQIRDLLCVLPLNVVNEKIFIVMWFWLIVLAFLSAVSVLFRIMTFSLSPIRTLLIIGQVKCVKRRIVSKIVRRYSFGDWFLLYLLGKNMNPYLFQELILELSKVIDNKNYSV